MNEYPHLPYRSVKYRLQIQYHVQHAPPADNKRLSNWGVYLDKPAGLVVDYLGIAADLKKALAFY
ncbi:MAG: hypothetical protein NTW85_01850 [Methylococcales bacterium]|nr:hypothetical protein [Methylococcales bacterium]